MLEQYREFAAAIPESVGSQAEKHLLQWRNQEDLCFALWYPSCGRRRLSALVAELILPERGDRAVHGNVGFTAEYFMRALATAQERQAGLALMHSHLGPGWQGMSPDDVRAESGHAGAAKAATGMPLLGLTLGDDGAWSGRFWQRVQPRVYGQVDASVVREVGGKLGLTYHPVLRPLPAYSREVDRSIKALGPRGWADVVRMRVGVVGLGSVGSLVNEALARLGAESIVLIDFDEIRPENRDRTTGAGPMDIGRAKVDVAADHALRCATSRALHVERVRDSIVHEEGYMAALDCDLLFCCVDRPWGRRILNHIAYAHVIPVVDGGILVRLKRDRMVGADWHCHTAGPERCCLECIGAYDPSVAGLEMQGLLDDPRYMAQLDPGSPLVVHENVFPFSMNLASLEIMQMLALVLGPVHDLGDQNYHYASGALDVTQDQCCQPDCLYPGIVATGDTRYRPTGQHCAAMGVGAVADVLREHSGLGGRTAGYRIRSAFGLAIRQVRSFTARARSGRR